jgi:hypothetical protein
MNGSLFFRLAAAAALVFSTYSFAAEPAKIADLVKNHELKTAIAVGQLYLKQEALFAARELLARMGKEQNLGADWSPANPLWQRAEQELVTPLMQNYGRRFADLQWLTPQWIALNSAEFAPADVETLLAHFATDMGKKQIQIVDHTVSVYVMGAYSFTGKLKENVPGVEQEMRTMQALYNDEDRDMRFNVRDNPDAQAFAVSPLGRKYFVSVIQKVTGMITREIDTTVVRLRDVVAGEGARVVRPIVEEYRRGKSS